MAKTKRPKDFMQLAKQIIDIATGETENNNTTNPKPQPKVKTKLKPKK